ncbi:hypothetical protein KAW65_00150 [candidate division WOR-3 bacterium]|nr:hypothetical protein [candidate division WOR-3 bacterium]
MEELEKLQEEAKRLIEQSNDEEFREMVFFWHGDEFLAENLRRSTDSCEDIDCVKGFVEKFGARIGKRKEEKKPVFRKLKRDTVVSYADGKELVGVYFADTDGSQALIECSSEKADRIIKVWNEEEGTKGGESGKI